jgi:hypothetical protein
VHVHGQRFEHVDAPQPSELLSKAALSAAKRALDVDDDLRRAFEEQARSMLKDGDVRVLAGA